MTIFLTQLMNDGPIVAAGLALLGVTVLTGLIYAATLGVEWWLRRSKE